MIIDNGRRVRLIIDQVFDGMAGELGGKLAFIPNRAGARPHAAKGALLDGVPVRIFPIKDASGPFWSARYEVIQ